MIRVWSVIRADSRPQSRQNVLALTTGLAWIVAGSSLAFAFPASLSLVPYSLLAPAIVVAAVLSGLWPGLIVGVLACVISFAFQLHNGDDVSVALIRLGLTGTAATGLCLIAEAYHREWHRAALKDLDLSTREAHLRTIVDTVPEAIIVLDRDGVVLSFNKGAERMFGLPAAHALGCLIGHFLPPDQNAHASLEILHSFNENGSDEAKPGIGKRTTGELFPIQVHFAPIMMGLVRHTTLFAVDLTPIQAAALREDELRRQLSQAWRLNSMGELASVLAHEISQPLAASLTYLTVAGEIAAMPDVDANRLTTIIDLAAAQGQRAGEIIKKMRQFVARTSSEQVSTSLAEVVGDLEPLMRLAATAAQVELTFQIQSPFPAVKVDRVQFQQVVYNLVRNAIDAVADREVRKVVLEIYPADGMAFVAVSDSGTGIDTSIVAHLMEPFVSTKEDGMGLGLSISKTIMAAHNGFIRTAQSALGGARFECGLPIEARGEIGA